MKTVVVYSYHLVYALHPWRVHNIYIDFFSFQPEQQFQILSRNLRFRMSRLFQGFQRPILKYLLKGKSIKLLKQIYRPFRTTTVCGKGKQGKVIGAHWRILKKEEWEWGIDLKRGLVTTTTRECSPEGPPLSQCILSQRAGKRLPCFWQRTSFYSHTDPSFSVVVFFASRIRGQRTNCVILQVFISYKPITFRMLSNVFVT